MSDVTRERLSAYLDDALTDAESAAVEKALRDSNELRQTLQSVMAERDRGDHSLGSIWRAERLTCASREQLGAYLLEALAPDDQNYLRFHLETIACTTCLANLADLRDRHQEVPAAVQKRQQRVFESSVMLLRPSPNPDSP